MLYIIILKISIKLRVLYIKAGFARNPKEGIQNSGVRMETGNPQKTGEQLLWRITQWRVVLRHNRVFDHGHDLPQSRDCARPLTQLLDKQAA